MVHCSHVRTYKVHRYTDTLNEKWIVSSQNVCNGVVIVIVNVVVGLDFYIWYWNTLWTSFIHFMYAWNVEKGIWFHVCSWDLLASFLPIRIQSDFVSFQCNYIYRLCVRWIENWVAQPTARECYVECERGWERGNGCENIVRGFFFSPFFPPIGLKSRVLWTHVVYIKSVMLRFVIYRN